jgi:2-amino-4-hydroxy-6-hydroxymethyldihydropteridine diphosphokinase
MEKVWLGLGSNLGNSQQILQDAWEKLGRESSVNLLSLSSPYVSDPVGMKSDNVFVNSAGLLETSLLPHELLGLLKRIEKEFGRKAKTGTEGYQDRLLDLDILYFANRKLVTDELQIPHPHVTERLFVLAPLAEIDPEHCDPHTGEQVRAMHNALLAKISEGGMASQKIQRKTWMTRK